MPITERGIAISEIVIVLLSAAFSLVGSEVLRMQQELNAVKGALEQVVHTMEQLDQALDVLPMTRPPQ